MSSKLSIAILLATVAFAAVPAKPFTKSPVTENEAKSTLVVIGYHCDEWGGIDAIAVSTDGPGPHLLKWDNEGMCGRRS